jgi:hypothetical protein
LIRSLSFARPKLHARAAEYGGTDIAAGPPIPRIGKGSLSRMKKAIVRFLWLCILLTGAGCLTDPPSHAINWIDALGAIQTPPASDVIVMDIALLEASPGDDFLTNGVWSQADEQVIELSHRPDLEDNGFRIGQLGGLPPAMLQERLSSPRSCPNPRRLRIHAGKEETILIGPPRSPSQFALRFDGASTSVTQEHGQHALRLLPSIDGNGRMHFRFTPIVITGGPRPCYQPAADRSGWVIAEDQPLERYERLTWDITIAPNEYILVGPRSSRPDSLGNVSFVRMDTSPPRQYVFVVRAAHAMPGVAAAQDDGNETTSRAPPIAQQAATSNP